MARSLSLALYLLAAGRGAPGAVALPPRPDTGPCLWLHAASPGLPLHVLAALALRLEAAQPGLGLVVTFAKAPPALPPLPRGCPALAFAPEAPEAAAAALAAWRPSVVVLCGAALPPGLIHAAEQADVPVFLVDAGASVSVAGGPALPGLQRALLRRLHRVLARDAEALRALRRAGVPPGRLEMAGPMAIRAHILPHNAAERDALAERMGTRPVWLAVAVPAAEEAAVLHAQQAAQKLAHRLLLILVPADAGRGAALAEAAAALGLRGGRRSEDAEPEDEDQIYIADTEGELGLWYRLAPVTFFGGTLGAGGGRDPVEAAGLGSAILHGPAIAPHDEIYARLAARDARLQVADTATLARAVVRLLAPERMARMAEGGWAVATEGSEVTDRVAGLLLQTLDAARD